MQFTTRAMVLTAMILAAGCGKKADRTPEAPKPSGESDVIDVPESDAEVNDAMATARRTMEQFLERLEHPPRSQSYIGLKARFEQGEHVEYLWLDHVTHENESFSGEIENEPSDISNVRLRQRVSVTLDRVADWVAVDDGRMVGGYTLRVLRARMTPKERASFDEELGIRRE